MSLSSVRAALCAFAVLLSAQGGDKSVKKTIPHNETGQLYDMPKDPYEATDLYEQKLKVVKMITSLLASFKESGRSVTPAR